MRLSIGGARQILNPTAFEIEGAVGSLDPNADGFAILELDEQTYMQTSANADGSFVLEYQEGSPEDHYATTGAVTARAVIEALQAYARGDGSWKTRFAWERVQL